LIRVKEVREQVALFGRFEFHHFGTVVWVRDDVVGADASEGDTLWHVVIRNTNKLGSNMLDVRAVVAHEDDNERFLVSKVRQCDALAIVLATLSIVDRVFGDYFIHVDVVAFGRDLFEHLAFESESDERCIESCVL
jgi:hypothetical protein